MPCVTFRVDDRSFHNQRLPLPRRRGCLLFWGQLADIWLSFGTQICFQRWLKVTLLTPPCVCVCVCVYWFQKSDLLGNKHNKSHRETNRRLMSGSLHLHLEGGVAGPSWLVLRSSTHTCTVRDQPFRSAEPGRANPAPVETG